MMEPQCAPPGTRTGGNSIANKARSAQHQRSVYTQHLDVKRKQKGRKFVIPRKSALRTRLKLVELSMEQAEALLGGDAPRENGAFLFRASSAGGGAVVLSMVWDKKVHHFVLKYTLVDPKHQVKELRRHLKKAFDKFSKSTCDMLPGVLTEYVGEDEIPADWLAGRNQLEELLDTIPDSAAIEPEVKLRSNGVNLRAKRDNVVSHYRESQYIQFQPDNDDPSDDEAAGDEVIYKMDPLYDDFDAQKMVSEANNAEGGDKDAYAVMCSSDYDCPQDALQKIQMNANLKDTKKNKGIPPSLPPKAAAPILQIMKGSAQANEEGDQGEWAEFTADDDEEEEEYPKPVVEAHYATVDKKAKEAARRRKEIEANLKMPVDGGYAEVQSKTNANGGQRQAAPVRPGDGYEQIEDEGEEELEYEDDGERDSGNMATPPPIPDSPLPPHPNDHNDGRMSPKKPNVIARARKAVMKRISMNLDNRKSLNLESLAQALETQQEEMEHSEDPPEPKPRVVQPKNAGVKGRRKSLNRDGEGYESIT
eukprot:m.59713 g.59713  ORF g.59713 m.59713 type:complete len:534 (-) comp11267_c0_seq1:145-1746(-)